MRVLVVYCHPSEDSFTQEMLCAFLRGLEGAGHAWELDDLYANHFNPVFSAAEYARDAYYRLDPPIPPDVRAEQEKLERANAAAFLYPVFWTEAPAMLVGWFQRVWTYGYAYGENRAMKPLQKALFLVSMGSDLREPLRKAQADAMKTVMLGDRIADRAKIKEMLFFDRSARGTDRRASGMRDALVSAYRAGLEFQAEVEK